MMISSTSMTSTSGVTLMSDLTPPLAPPRSIDIADSPKFQISDCRCQILTPAITQGFYAVLLRRLPNKVVDEFRRRVVHLDVEVLDAATQIIIEPHRRNRDDQ